MNYVSIEYFKVMFIFAKNLRQHPLVINNNNNKYSL